jgi:hypothetical protein
MEEAIGSLRLSLLIKEVIKKTCKIGLIHREINYLATPLIGKAKKRLIRVNLNHLPLDSEEEIKDGLLMSCQNMRQVFVRLISTARGYSKMKPQYY